MTRPLALPVQTLVPLPRPLSLRRAGRPICHRTPLVVVKRVAVAKLRGLPHTSRQSEPVDDGQ